MVKFVKIQAGEYAAIDEDGNTVAHAFKSGAHLDDYPWDWSLATKAVRGSTTGAADTLRSAKERIRYSLGEEELWETDSSDEGHS